MSWKTTIGALTVVAMLAGRSLADKPKPASTPTIPEDLEKLMVEAAKPGKDHAKLQPLVGKWTYTCKCWMDPSKPPLVSKGTIERKWILGGRFLEEKYVGTDFNGKPGFEALGLVGFDKAQKKYIMTWICNGSTGTSTGVGVSESAGKFTFQTACSCPLEKEPIQGRDEIRIESPDRIVTVSYRTVDGKDIKGMEIIAVRKK